MTNSGYAYRERVDRSAAGATVLAYLSGRYAHSSFETWQSHIAAGRVLVDGAVASSEKRLDAGAVVTWNRPPWSEPRAPTSLAVLYRDDDVLAVAKPRGLPAMPGGGFLERTLLTRVRTFDPNAAPLHRLGRATSGITLFTRNRRARRALTTAWQQGDVRRDYVGLAAGSIVWDDAVLDEPIGSAPHPILGSVAAAAPDGKPSRSRVRVLERRATSTLVTIGIDTGRTHQIRIHLAAAGHPLAGDPLYASGGIPLASTRALPGDGGYLLHAHRLEFAHPTGGQPVVVTCVPPPSLRREDTP